MQINNVFVFPFAQLATADVSSIAICPGSGLQCLH